MPLAHLQDSEERAAANGAKAGDCGPESIPLAAQASSQNQAVSQGPGMLEGQGLSRPL